MLRRLPGVPCSTMGIIETAGGALVIIIASVIYRATKSKDR